MGDYMMKVLHLTLKKKWFNMIASGEKKEEYREVKMYWATRLTTGFPNIMGIDMVNPDFKDFDYIQFRDGYNRHARVINKECLGLKLGAGNPEWGAELNEVYYIIKLGETLT